jgi:hypothetical protein
MVGHSPPTQQAAAQHVLAQLLLVYQWTAAPGTVPHLAQQHP